MTYIAAEDLAAHLGLSGELTAAEGGALDRAIAAACSAVDEYCGRTFTVPADDAEGTTRVYRPIPSGASLRVFIDDAVEVDGVEVSHDGQAWTARASSEWWTEPLNAAADGVPIDSLRTDTSWSRWLRVTAIWGWPTVPPAVPSASLIKAARLYRRKDSPEGLEGTDGFGVVRISRFEDGDVQLLLNPLRRHDRVEGIA